MLNRKFIFLMTGLIFSQITLAATADSLGLEGTYKCNGYDMHEGSYANAIATLTLDAQDSSFVDNYGAYHVVLIESDGTRYIGEAAASGNSLAIYIENTTPGMTTD